MISDFDIVVVGGGLVGGVFATSLASSGLRIAVIESRSPPQPSDKADNRVFAITRASENILCSLSVWDSVTALGALPFERMCVWDAGGTGEIRFDCADIGEPWMGHIVEQRNLLLPLYERLDGEASLSLIANVRLEDLQWSANGAELILDDGRRITTRLVVGADGAQSRVRGLAGLAVEVHPYSQSALVANVKTECGHENTAWQRFLPGGPLAFLPMANGDCSIVWSCASEEADRLLALDGQAFRDALGNAFDHRLGRIQEHSGLVGWPLQRLHAPNYVAERVVLIGDAAHGIHPLAGQGMNLGLLDAAVLAQVIEEANCSRQDFSQRACLRRYERWRKGNNLLVQRIMDGFHQLFGSQLPLLVAARNLGLGLMDRAGPVKDRVMREAMGLEGDLPRAARAA